MAAKYYDTITTTSGAAINGGSVYATDSSNNRATLYSDSALTQSIGTVATSDANGYVEFYLPNGVYSITQYFGGVSKTIAGVQIYDLANLSAIPVVWSGAAADMHLYNNVTITCSTAPSTPYTIQSGDGIGAQLTQTAISNTAAGISTTTTINAVGRYSLPGGVISLTGGTNGVFSIVGTF